jgi:hypothetical protein
LEHIFFSKIRYSELAPSVVVKQATMFFGTGSALSIERIERVEKHYEINASGQGNIINIAEYMTGVTNTVNQNVSQSSTSDDVKELIRTLAAQLGAAAPKIDTEIAERMGSDLKALSEEIKNPSQGLVQTYPGWAERSRRNHRRRRQACPGDCVEADALAGAGVNIFFRARA